MTTELDKFEAWVSASPFNNSTSTFPDRSDLYIHYSTQMAWNAWLASRAATKEEDAGICEARAARYTKPYTCHEIVVSIATHRQDADAIRASK